MAGDSLGSIFQRLLGDGWSALPPAVRALGLLVESFGPVRVRIALVVDGDRLRFDVRGWSLWALPLPRALAPGGDSDETQRGGRFVFHIVIGHPWTGLVVGYTGWLAPHPDATQLLQEGRKARNH